MKRIYWLTGAGLALILVVAAARFQASTAMSKEKSPYKAAGFEFVVWEGPHEDCGPDRIKADIEGSGQGTHLGNYTIVRRHCFDPATGTFEDGFFEQTAASGDKVWGTYQVSIEQVLEFAEDGSPVVVVVDGPWTITGGSGRFASAEGEGNMRGDVNLVTHQGDFEFEGWISYSASDRSK